MKKWLLSVTLLASWLGYSITPLSAFAEEKTLSVGFVAPMTGPDAEAGENIKVAATMALEEAGYKVGDYKLDVHWIDEGGNPAIATSNYEGAIVKDKIQVGVLGWRSDCAAAIIPLLSRYKIPNLFSIGASGLINEKVNSDREKFGYWTKIYPEPQKVTGAYADAFEAAVEAGSFKPHSKSVALYAEETDWGRSALEAFTKAFKDKGWEVKAKDFFPKDTNEFSAYLAKVQSLDVALVAGTADTPQTATSLVKQYRASGLKQPLVLDGLGYVANWYETAGAASDNVLDEVFVFGSPKAQEFASRYQKITGHAPGPVSAGLAYDGTKMFLQVLKVAEDRYGELDAQKIQEVIRTDLWTGKITYAGIMNQQYKYTEDSVPDPVTGSDFFSVPVVQYKAGAPVVVWPRNIAQAPLVFGAK